MVNEEFILKTLRIFYSGHKTWLVKTLVIAGLSIIARPLWEPLVVAHLNKYIQLDVPNSDWAGWILLLIGIPVYVLNEWFGKSHTKPNSKDVGL